MEMILFVKDGKTYTRFKVERKELPKFSKMLFEINAWPPSKASSRFVYFEVEGDFLNNAG